MSLKTEQMRAVLDPDQPMHVDVHRLDLDSAAMIIRFVADPDLVVAVRAVQLAARIAGGPGRRVLEVACSSPRCVVRQAVAAAFGHRCDLPNWVVMAMLRDPQPAVRAEAIAGLASRPIHRSIRFHRMIGQLASGDPDARVRELALALRRRGGEV